MIISRCPLRISLAGGSTDLQSFVRENGVGKVISFPANLYTYITITKRFDNNYRINYSKTEQVVDPKKINNDIAREVIRTFNLHPVTIGFTSDIPSTGSGLASSSSYTVAAVAAAAKFVDIELSQFEMCSIAHSIELRFNPLTGYQDCYGCGLPSLKMMEFFGGEKIKIASVNRPDVKNMFLYSTDVERSSTKILKTIDNTKSVSLLKTVDDLYESLNNLENESTKKILKEAWEIKKSTSSWIMNKGLVKIEEKLNYFYDIFMIKLCGAGGGGYYFIMTDDDKRPHNFKDIGSAIPVKIDNEGVKTWVV